MSEQKYVYQSVALEKACATKWSGSAYNRATGKPVYAENNVCVGCKLLYPKTESRQLCVICRKPTRKKSAKKKWTGY
jgi:rRNA maturation endonuclease Nob1